MKKKQVSKTRVKLHVKKGDTVIVVAGDDKGTQGRVLTVLINENRAIVEGVNFVHRHTKPNATNTQGGIIKKEAPVHLSNLMLIDPSTGEATRIGRKKENDVIVRYAKKSGEVIN